MDPIKTAFIQGYITGLIPLFFVGLYSLASYLGKRAADRNEIKRLQRKALERLAGER